MDAQTLNEFKGLFLELYKDTLSNLTKDKEEYFVGQAQGDQVDQTQAIRDQLLGLRLMGRENFFLKKVEAALNRIESGEFGDCEECGADIGVERLRARPTTTMCIHCKEEQERVENQCFERGHKERAVSIKTNVMPLISHEQGPTRISPKLWVVNGTTN